MSTVARVLLRGHLTLFVVYWLIMTLCFTVIEVVQPIEDGQRAWVALWILPGFAPPKYFLFVIGLLLAVVHLPIYVAHGVSRRTFAAGSAYFAGLVGAAFALMTMLGFVLQDQVLQQFEPTESWGGAMRAGLGNLVVNLVYLGAGWLVGVGYYRTNGWLGTLLLPLTLAPVIVVEVAFRNGWDGMVPIVAGSSDRWRHGPYSFAVALGIGVVCAVAAVVAGYIAARSMPIRAKKV